MVPTNTTALPTFASEQVLGPVEKEFKMEKYVALLPATPTGSASSLAAIAPYVAAAPDALCPGRSAA